MPPARTPPTLDEAWREAEAELRPGYSLSLTGHPGYYEAAVGSGGSVWMAEVSRKSHVHALGLLTRRMREFAHGR